jgi:hypothetical protein
MGVAETSSAAGLRAGCTVGARSELDAHGSAAHRPRWVVCAVPPLSPSSVRSSGRLKTAALPLGCAHASARLNARCCRKARRAAPHRTAAAGAAGERRRSKSKSKRLGSRSWRSGKPASHVQYSTVLYCGSLDSAGAGAGAGAASCRQDATAGAAVAGQSPRTCGRAVPNGLLLVCRLHYNTEWP